MNRKVRRANRTVQRGTCPVRRAGHDRPRAGPDMGNPSLNEPVGGGGKAGRAVHSPSGCCECEKWEDAVNPPFVAGCIGRAYGIRNDNCYALGIRGLMV